MRYLAIFTIIFSLFTPFAEAHSPVYVLDNADVSTFYSGFQQALERSPNYQASAWANPRTGLSGETVPLKTLRISNGQICREYLATVQLEGATQQSVGTACRQANGSWQIVGEELVQGGGAQLKFVVVRQQQVQRQECVHGYHAPASQPSQTQGHPQRGNKRFHSHELQESLQQKDPVRAPREQQRPASKLIKLVGY